MRGKRQKPARREPAVVPRKKPARSSRQLDRTRKRFLLNLQPLSVHIPLQTISAAREPPACRGALVRSPPSLRPRGISYGSSSIGRRSPSAPEPARRGKIMRPIRAMCGPKVRPYSAGMELHLPHREARSGSCSCPAPPDGGEEHEHDVQAPSPHARPRPVDSHPLL